MGNKQSCIETGHFFKKPQKFDLNISPIGYDIGNDVMINVNLLSLSGPIISMNKKDALHQKLSAESINFDSHMRDFEVIPSYNLIIARGQGIGVIIDFSRGLYIKMWKDKKSHFGANLFVTEWPTKDILSAKNILNNDLTLGYDIHLTDYDGNVHRLREELTEEDTMPTPIFIKDFEKYATYNEITEPQQSKQKTITKKIPPSTKEARNI